ncbi:MAG: LTA synthase family protein [Bacteroidales bacterium]|nr:LTA synthase family protein [Bacteroidales bacterium]
MKVIVTALLKSFLFWIIYFFFLRIVFLLYNYGFLKLEEISVAEAIASCFFGLKLDVSVACYILLFPFFLLFVQSIILQKWINTLRRIYTGIIILIFSIITATELGIYSEWKTKLSYKALTYLSNPDEVFNSISTSQFFLLILIVSVQFIIGYFIYKKGFYKWINIKKRNIKYSILFLLITPCFLFLGIRGGLQEIPITRSQSYYSKHNILNLAALNSGYNLFMSMMENYRFIDENPFKSFPEEKASLIVRKIHEVQKDTTISIFKTKRPNIVVFLLESWAGDLIESLSGFPGITPNFKKLEKEGILFTEHFASGNRSQQAMASLFGGFPALPITTLTNHPEKYEKLPSLIKILNREGYHTSFYFGGQLIYGNIKSYIIFNEFDDIVEGKDFKGDVIKGKLGIHDEFVFNRQINDLNKMKQPFFSVIFTLSSHSPYDFPSEKQINFGGKENSFLNSAYYTDKCLGKYFDLARKQPWFDNTIFILVADHSHNTNSNYPLETFEYRRIPLLIMGNPLKDEFKGRQICRIASNTDIPATLLKQLNLDTRDFFWSKNLFNPYSPDFAYFELNEGAGWKRPEGFFVINKLIDHYYVINMEPGVTDAQKDSVIIEGKAYLQQVFQEFMDF